MSARRQATGLGAIVGVGALAAVAGAAIGGVLGFAAAAFVALFGAFALYRRRPTSGRRC